MDPLSLKYQGAVASSSLWMRMNSIKLTKNQLSDAFSKPSQFLIRKRFKWTLFFHILIQASLGHILAGQTELRQAYPKQCVTQRNLTHLHAGYARHGPRQLPVARAEHSNISHFGHLDTLGMDHVSFQSQGLNTVKSHTLVTWIHSALTPSASSRNG